MSTVASAVNMHADVEYIDSPTKPLPIIEGLGDQIDDDSTDIPTYDTDMPSPYAQEEIPVIPPDLVGNEWVPMDQNQISN